MLLSLGLIDAQNDFLFIRVDYDQISLFGTPVITANL